MLVRFMRFMRVAKPTCGRVVHHTVGLIHWPDMLLHHQTMETLAGIFFSVAELAEGARRQLIDPSCIRGRYYEAFTHYRLRRVREAVEALLAPLLLPTFIPEAQAIIETYLAPKRALGVPAEAALMDERSCTVFRRIRTDRTASIRICARPATTLEDVLAHTYGIPAPLAILYYAWIVALQQVGVPHDPAEIGVDFLSTGHILVNWSRFRASSFWPTTLKTLPKVAKGITPPTTYDAVPHPGDVHQQLLALPKLHRLDKAFLSIDAHSHTERFGKTCPSPTLKLSLESGAFAYNDDGVPASCTLIDPARLVSPRLFDGALLMRKRTQATQRVRIQHMRHEQATRSPTRATVIPVVFRPADYLDDFIREPLRSQLQAARRGERTPEARAAEALCPWWFDNDYTETLYAVKRGDEFAFSSPPRLGESAGDAEVWRRALESVCLTEKRVLAAYGDDVMSEQHIEAASRSEFLRSQKRQALLEYADAAVYEAITAGGPGTKAELRRLQTKLQREYGTNGENMSPGHRWYHDCLRPEALKKIVQPTAFRRVLHVLLPEPDGSLAPDTALRDVAFIRPMGVEVFAKFALASMHLKLDGAEDNPCVAQHPELSALLNVDRDAACRTYLESVPSSAPYALAWVRFCRTQQQQLRHVDTGTPDREYAPGDTWTPSEDVFLLTHWRKFPAMTTEMREGLQRVLGRDTLLVYNHRLTKLRQRFAEFKHPREYAKYDMRRLPLDEATARSLVIRMGLWQLYTRKQHTAFQLTDQPLPFKYLRKLSATEITALILPESYLDTAAWQMLAAQLTTRPAAAPAPVSAPQPLHSLV